MTGALLIGEEGVDLKKYFQKIREVEARIVEPSIHVVSLETPDGGKAGVVTEVPRAVAAKLMVEGRAVLANDAVRDRFIALEAEKRTAAEKTEAASRLQFVIVQDTETPRPQVVQQRERPAEKTRS